MKKFLIFLLVFGLLSTCAYGTSKEDIIKLSKAGTRDEVIMTHLRAQAELKLTPDDIKDLKEAGVSDEIINFLIENDGDMTKFYNPGPPRRYYDDYWIYRGGYFIPPWYWPGGYWWGPPCHPHHGH